MSRKILSPRLEQVVSGPLSLPLQSDHLSRSYQGDGRSFPYPHKSVNVSMGLLVSLPNSNNRHLSFTLGMKTTVNRLDVCENSDEVRPQSRLGSAQDLSGLSTVQIPCTFEPGLRTGPTDLRSLTAPTVLISHSSLPGLPLVQGTMLNRLVSTKTITPGFPVGLYTFRSLVSRRTVLLPRVIVLDYDLP